MAGVQGAKEQLEGKLGAAAQALKVDPVPGGLPGPGWGTSLSPCHHKR